MKIPSNHALESENNSKPTLPHGRSVWIDVVAVFGVVATLMLGQWQLSRGEQKEQMQALLKQQMSLQPLSALDLKTLGSKDSQLFLNRRINLSGKWSAELTVYLANRTHAGKSGFWVMTPLRLDNSTTVMVERGWVPWNALNPSEKPTDVQTPAGGVNIEAVVVDPPSKMLELWGGSTLLGRASQTQTLNEQSNEPSYLKSAIWQNFDLNLFEAQTGLRLSAVVRQFGEPSEGLIRELPSPGVSSDRNFGYAVQWFLLSALIAGLYIWFQWIKPRIHARKH